MITKIIIDYIFSAIAGMGFGIVFNPPFKVLIFSGLFAGAGHSLRLLLMAQYSVNIFVATLVSAFFIGILGFLMGRIEGCPSEIFTFPAVLPMIPGIYAYETFLSVIKFLSENGESKMRALLPLWNLREGIVPLPLPTSFSEIFLSLFSSIIIFSKKIIARGKCFSNIYCLFDNYAGQVIILWNT